jgi:hypothetical protein
MKTYKPISADRTDVLRAKKMYGIWYGASLGFFFALFAWGPDAYELSKINSFDPWLKFVVAVLLCTIVGGLTGWIAARQDKPLLAMFIWIVPGLLYAWLVVNLPFVIFPRLLSLLSPDVTQYIKYTYYPEFITRSSIAFTWIVIFVAIVGLLQIPLSEGAVFSTSIVGKLIPILIGMILMSICGVIVDGLTNEFLRGPVAGLNDSIQFAIDHRGQQVDKTQARVMRQGSLRGVQDLITPQRKLLVSRYTADLGEVDVLVKFEKAWVECQVFYNQPVNCKQVGSIP